MVEPDQNEANGKPPGPVEDLAGGAAEDTAEAEVGQGETSDPEELKARLGIKNNHIRELFEQITASRLAADEARATKEASEGHIAALERDRARLKERIRDLEEEARGRRRRREGLERQIERLRRELERKDAILLNMTEAMKAIAPPEPRLAQEEEGPPPTADVPREYAVTPTPQPGRVGPQTEVEAAQERREESGMHMPEVGGGPLPHDQQRPSERPWWRRVFGG